MLALTTVASSTPARNAPICRLSSAIMGTRTELHKMHSAAMPRTWRV